jgi:hypothetical protein
MRDRVRLGGTCGVLGGLLWSLGIALEYGLSYKTPHSGTGFYVLLLVFLVAQGAFLCGMQGLEWSGAVGTSRLGRWSLRIFQLGLVFLMTGSIIYIATGNQNSPFFPLGGLSIAVTGLLVGIAVWRAVVLPGWRRVSPTLVGAYYVFGMLVPAIAAGPNTSGPPAFLEFLWGVTWVLMGLALLIPVRVETGRIFSADLTEAQT